MRTWILIIILALAAGALLADPMPEFRLPNELGKNVALEDLLGKGPVLIDFWADYCQPCKQGMVKLNDLALKYDSLTVVVVSLDAPKTQQKAKNYIKSKDYHFITLYDADKVLAKKLNIENPPYTLILDNTGEVVFQHLGYEPGMEAEYEHQIRTLWGMPEEVPVEMGQPVPETMEDCKCGE